MSNNATPRPQNLHPSDYATEPRQTTEEEDTLEAAPPRRVIREPPPRPEEPSPPDEREVAGAVVAKGRMLEVGKYNKGSDFVGDDEDKMRVTPRGGGPSYYEAREGFEEIDPRHPAATQETWIGVIETRAQRRRRRLPWAGRR
jgi:hypothetical protein